MKDKGKLLDFIHLENADGTDNFAMDDFLDADNKDAEFDWDSLLKQPNLEVIPEACLSHVHRKANLILKAGMKIEVPYTEEDKTKYWIATVVMTLGPVVRLRYFGDSNSRDMLIMIKNLKAHPVGWCSRSNKTLTPPSYITSMENKESEDLQKEKINKLLEELKGEETVQEYATFEHEQFVPGMKLEIQDEYSPYHVWVANILENYGGRLQLRYDTPDSEEPCFWLFHTSHRIHPFGWAKSQGEPWALEKPSYMEGTQSKEAWDALSEMNMFNFEMECKISHIKTYKYKPPQHRHSLIEGSKLEAIHPKKQSEISSATVVKIFDPYYFLVQIDESDLKFLAAIDHPYIFPVGWAALQGLKIKQSDSSGQESQLQNISTESFPSIVPRHPHIQVTPGMMLEAVNPLNRSLMCVGRVLAVYQNLLLVHLDIQAEQTEFLYHVMDCEVFPLGWSRATGHPILPPVDSSYLMGPRIIPAVSLRSTPEPPRYTGYEKVTIYVNYKCFSGPFLSKSKKLAILPKQMGPGRVKLVLMEVVKRIANLAYVQMRILRELEAPSGDCPAGRTREELKVKYKTRVYKGTIEVPTRLDAVQPYCEEICRRLQVCPNLISQKHIPDCPLNCIERNKIKSSKDKKTNTKQSFDYKSFIYKPLVNPVTLLNRRPFQEDIPPPRDNSSEETIVWNKEKCLRKRKVNVFLEREKKRLQRDEDEETGSSKGKESEENSGEEGKKPRRGRPPTRTQGNAGKTEPEQLSVTPDPYLPLRVLNESQLPLPDKANPLAWTEDDVFQCVSQIPNLCQVAPQLKAEAIDGLALTQLDFYLCRHSLALDIDTSLLLCRLVEIVSDRYWTLFLQKNQCAEAS